MATPDTITVKPSDDPNVNLLRTKLKAINRQIQILEARKQAVIDEIKKYEV